MAKTEAQKKAQRKYNHSYKGKRKIAASNKRFWKSPAGMACTWKRQQLNQMKAGKCLIPKHHPAHPDQNPLAYDKYYNQYRINAQFALGRRLKTGEVVHHINGDHDDNRNCNLMIVDPAFHTWLHHQMDKKTS